jgi:hypothetical protein
MKVSDPLVLIQGSSAQAGLAGWAVAADIIARLSDFGLSDRIDVKAILGPAISNLSEADLEQLARQINGPLLDTPRFLLRAWQDKDQNDTHTSPHARTLVR